MAVITKYWDGISGDALTITTSEQGITFTSDPNETLTERQLSITVKLVGFDVSRQVLIKQEAQALELTVLGFGDTALSIGEGEFLTTDIDSIGTWEIDDNIEPEPDEEVIGNRYTGSYTPSASISETNKTGLVYEGLAFTNSATRVRAIELFDCTDVIIRNCKFEGNLHHSIYMYGCTNVLIEDCTFENVWFSVLASTSTGLKVKHCDVLNITGRKVVPPGEQGDFVQCINVTGAGNEISYNAVENFEALTDIEDGINLFGYSGGTALSPFIIKKNWFRGGGSNESGTGIVVGDYGGNDIIVEDNIVVNGPQVGFGVAGGQNIIMRRNKAFSNKANKNIGFVIWDWAFANEGFQGSEMANVEIYDNEANYGESWSAFWGELTPEDGVTVFTNNIHNPSLNANILPAVILNTLDKSKYE